MSVFARCRSSFVGLSFWTVLASFLESLNQFQPNLIYNIYGWWGVKLYNSWPSPYPSEASGVMLYPSRFRQSITFILLYYLTSISQTSGTIEINSEFSTKTVKLMAPRSGVLALGRGPIDYVVKMHQLFKENILCPRKLANELSTKL